MRFIPISKFPRKGRIGSFLPQFLLPNVKIGQIPGKVPGQNTKTEFCQAENIVIACYRSYSSATPYIWIIEFKGKAIGYCILYSGSGDDEIYADFAKRDCRGVEIMIGRRDLWGQGIGTEAVRLVTKFAFERDNAEVLCVIDIGEFNLRRRRVFEKNGFEIYATCPVPPKGGISDLYYVLTREQYERILIKS